MQGSIVCLHSSLRSFGYVDGGAETVIRAFLQADCTLVVPTFTYDCEVAPPPERLILQNGFDPNQVFEAGPAQTYNPRSGMISREMGAIPARLLQMRGTARGAHPLNSFAALGPLADEIIGAQNPMNVYGPLKQVYARQPAFVALVGVDLTSATPIHFAEEKAGRRLFRRWAKNADGSTLEVEVGSCSDGFNNLQPPLKNLELNATVAESAWKVYPFKGFIDTLAQAILQNPSITHCADPDCVRCNDMVRGGPLL